MGYYFVVILNRLDFDNLLSNLEIYLANQAHYYYNCSLCLQHLFCFIEAIKEQLLKKTALMILTKNFLLK
jgi:hypothetical protein